MEFEKYMCLSVVSVECKVLCMSSRPSFLTALFESSLSFPDFSCLFCVLLVTEEMCEMLSHRLWWWMNSCSSRGGSGPHSLCLLVCSMAAPPPPCCSCLAGSVGNWLPAETQARLCSLPVSEAALLSLLLQAGRLLGFRGPWISQRSERLAGAGQDPDGLGPSDEPALTGMASGHPAQFTPWGGAGAASPQRPPGHMGPCTAAVGREATPPGRRRGLPMCPPGWGSVVTWAGSGLNPNFPLLGFSVKGWN